MNTVFRAILTILFALIAMTSWAAPGPDVTLNVPNTTPFIGSQLSFDVVFDNTGGAVGYGPFVDIILPSRGKDGQPELGDDNSDSYKRDGIFFYNADYSGLSIPPSDIIELTFPVPDDWQEEDLTPSTGCVDHPLAKNTDGDPVEVCGQAGDTLVVIRLPFGSFVPNQPPARITVNADVSELADVGEALNIQARAGFQFGKDPLDNPTTDPSILSQSDTDSSDWTTSQPVTPQIITLEKTAQGGLTGANYPRQYKITIEIAPDQVINELVITDTLPSDVVYISSTASQGTVVTEPVTGEVVGLTNNQVRVELPDGVTGVVTLSISYFVPEADFELEPTIPRDTAAGQTSQPNEVTVEGDWANPIDPRDDGVEFTLAQDNVTRQDIALQLTKTASMVGDVAPKPGEIVRYTLRIRVSDYFAFDQLVIDDILGDGHRWFTDGTRVPTLALSGHQGTLAAEEFDADNYVINDQFSAFGNDDSGDASQAGTTEIVFDVSQELIRRDPAGFGRILGGCFPAGTGANDVADCNREGNAQLEDASTASVITVVFYAEIQEFFSDNFPSGNQAVVQGDTVSNTATLDARVLEDLPLTPTGSNQSSADGDSVTLPVGTLTKDVYRVNGAVPSSPFTVRPGDTVTYRLTYNLPTHNFEQFALIDYLPLPVFAASELDTFVDEVSADAPPAGSVKFGPDDTFRNFLQDNELNLPLNGGRVPDLSTNTSGNFLRLDWGDFETDSSVPDGAKTVDILLTVTVSDSPFADGLLLTNQAEARESNTSEDATTAEGIVQITLEEPELEITKGVASTTNTSSSLDPDSVGDPVDSNLLDADAGDRVSFVITLDNVGSAPAFDIAVWDDQPAGLVNCGNVNVSGASVTGGDLFDSGDPLVLESIHENGRAVISYDCDIATSVNPRAEIVNTATANWKALAGAAESFADIQDDASISIAEPALSKTSISIDPGPAGSSVVPGDVVTYQLTVTLPEGTTPGLVIEDILPAGFEYQDNSVIVDDIGFVGTVSTSPTVGVDGQELTITFAGNTVATGTEGSEGNSFKITYNAKVLDTLANSATTSLQAKTNNVSLDYTGRTGPDITDRDDINFGEPVLDISKSFNPSSDLQAGDLVTITLRLENTGTAPAFDIVITDVLNDGDGNDLFDLTPPDPITDTTDDLTGFTFAFDTAKDTVTYESEAGSRLEPDQSRTFTFTAKVRDDVVTGSTFTNTAKVEGYSQDGDVDDRRKTENTDTAEPIVKASTVAKSITAKSEEAWTTGNNVAIGEVITYQITYTLPSGQTRSPADSAIFTDTLPAGQEFLAGTAKIRASVAGVTVQKGNQINGVADGGTLPTENTLITPEWANQKLQFDVGNIQNNHTEEAQIIITLDALVMNTSANNRGDSKTNTAALNYLNNANNPQSQTATHAVTIVEPNLEITKTANPTTASGGDEITFTVVVSNPSITNVTQAWEVTIADTLPDRFETPTLTSATLSRGEGTNITTCGSFAGQALAMNMSCLDADQRYLAPGETITVVYKATLDPEVEFEEVVTNTAEVQGTSLPGDKGTDDAAPGEPGSETGERTGSGEVNNLTATKNAKVTADRPTVTKAVEDDSLQIGEITTVTLTIPVPVGQTGNFKIEDNLPTGLSYTGQEIVITLPGSNFTASETPSTTPGAGTDPLKFDFGTVQNNGTASQNIEIQYQVQVENILANQRNTPLTNTATLTYDGAKEPYPSDTATINVREPKLELEKTITAGTPATAGSEVTYQLVVQNTDAHATAYRMELKDVLPDGLLGANNGAGPFFTAIGVTNPDNSVVKSEGEGGALTAADAIQTEPNNTLTWPFFNLPPNTALTITYNATVIDQAPTGATLTNEVDAEYNSLSDGTGRNGTDVLDDADETKLNNYGKTTSRDLVLDATLAIQKTVSDGFSSSLAIGDEVQFDLKVSLLPGVTDNVVVIDTLPDGLAFVEMGTIIADQSISYTGDGSATQNPDGIITIEMGNVTVPPDTDSANRHFTIPIKARIKNIEGNQNQDKLPNTAKVTSDTAPDGATHTLEVTVVEPVLQIVKTPDTTSPALGNTVTYEVVVSHAEGSAADAYKVELTDLIPSGLTYISDSTTGATVNADDPAALVFDLGTIQNGSSKTFSYRVTVDLDAVVGEPLENTITGTFASRQDATGAADSGRTGPLNEEDTLNDYRVTASATVTPGTTAFIYPVKTVSRVGEGDVVSGDTLEYTIVLTNQSGQEVSNVVLEDSIPAHTTYVADSATTTSGTISVDGDPVKVRAEVGTLGAEAATITFRVTVNADTPAGTVITNQGLVDSDQTVPTPTDADGIPDNGFQPTDVPVGGYPELQEPLYAEKTVSWLSDENGNSIIDQGDTLRYTIVLHNWGNEILTGLEFKDTIPGGLTYIDGSAVPSSNVTVNGQDLAWSDLSDLEPGQSLKIRFDVTIATVSGESQTYVNQGTASWDDGSTLTDGNGNPYDGNQPTSITAGGASPDLKLQKRVFLAVDQGGTGVANPGDTLEYRMTLVNTGSGAASNVRLNDDIPAYTTIVPGSVFTSLGAVVTEDPVSVNIGTLNPGQSVTVSFRVTINSDIPEGTVISNTAVVSSEELDDVPSDDDTPTLIPVQPGDDPSPVNPSGMAKSIVAKSEGSDSDKLLIGEVVTFEFQVKMPAGLTKEVFIEDTLPKGLTYVQNSAELKRSNTLLSSAWNPGSINSSTEDELVSLTDDTDVFLDDPGDDSKLWLYLGNVTNSDADGEAQYTFRYDAVVANIAGVHAGTELSNNATVAFLNALNRPVELTPVEKTVKVAEADIKIEKSAAPTTLPPSGGTTTFTLTVTNEGTATGYDLEIKDQLPAGYSNLSNVGSSSENGVTGVENNSSGNTVLFNIDVFPVGGRLEITFTADAEAGNAGESINNTAQATWTSLPGAKGTNDASPGDPGTETGERIYDEEYPSVNNNINTGSATVFYGTASLNKTVLNPQTRYAIGETIEYQGELTIPGGFDTSSAKVVDELDAGLEYITGSLGITYNEILVDTQPAEFSQDGQTLTADFGRLRNDNTDERTLTLKYEARVANVLPNQNGTTLKNNIKFQHKTPGTDDDADPISDETSITVGEPQIDLTKTITSGTADKQAGDIVSFRVDIDGRCQERCRI
ncbi:isopeptide-forming domain-containing fimbrial protein [Desulfonatronovibrio magnus]|uniref:isopeptide-forming domain-containing fimbrial protein n=1 Tax=Desulfonatronovibrio magnus TaxID=698827 RepID=UPI0005EB5D5F|nr:isopeptide-forming domain-containing fimbrial protein [Desulfonatronovibrio magnus]